MQLISENVISKATDGLVLHGGRCKSDNRIVFPMPEGAEAALYEKIPLKSEGTLWSYTVQRFPPKSPPYLGPNTPDAFQPFALGYVELEDQVIVETRIATDDFDALKVGIPMRLTAIEYTRNAAGDPIGTYAFEPIASRS
ncbi:MAG: OB-fold domain-containing protein [Pseudomonadota bacterium]